MALQDSRCRDGASEDLGPQRAQLVYELRLSEIETCPEPTNSNEISVAIREFNTTAEFLAQNTLAKEDL